MRIGSRYIAIDPTATSLTFVSLGGASALIGPQWAVEKVQTYSDEQLADRSTPSALGDVGRSRGPTALYFADEIGTTIGRHDPLISHEPDHVLALERLCAPDDVIAADLSRKRSWFTLLSDDRPANRASPLASAGYQEWEGLLADVGVLTASSARRQGNAQVVARLATNDAIDEGLIPQWQASIDNGTSRRLASRLGYQEWGVFVSIDLDASVG